jgi:hypothetical protein
LRIGDVTVTTPATVTDHRVYRFGDDAKARLTVDADISHATPQGERSDRSHSLPTCAPSGRNRPHPPLWTATAPVARAAAN